MNHRIGLIVKTMLIKKAANQTRFAKRLEALNLTEEEYARASGMRLQTVRDWASGKSEIPPELEIQVFLHGVTQQIAPDGKRTVRAKRFGDYVWSRNGRPIHHKNKSTKESTRVTMTEMDKAKNEKQNLNEFDLKQVVAKRTGLYYSVIKEYYLDDSHK